MATISEIAGFADVPLVVEVELDRRTLAVHDILDLRPGIVIGMRRSAGENIDIYVGGARVGSGEILVVDNTMAVRITSFEDRD